MVEVGVVDYETRQLGGSTLAVGLVELGKLSWLKEESGEGRLLVFWVGDREDVVVHGLVRYVVPGSRVVVREVAETKSGRWVGFGIVSLRRLIPRPDRVEDGLLLVYFDVINEAVRRGKVDLLIFQHLRL